MNNSDLTVLIDQTTLNIRVVILLQTPQGMIFEKSKDGYLFAIGGRVKITESTEQAAIRELEEELNLKNIKLNLAGVIENFFTMSNGKDYHEINFVYKAALASSLELNTLSSDNEGYICLNQSDMDKYDIRPQAILQIADTRERFMHLINREN